MPLENSRLGNERNRTPKIVRQTISLSIAISFLFTGHAQLEGISTEIIADHDTTSIPELVGMKTYRVYAKFFSAEDRLLSVFGHEDAPLSLTADSGFYNPEFYNTDNAADVTTEYFQFFPWMAFDSWFTIGYSPGDTTESSTSFVGMSGPLSTFSNGGDLIINDQFGGSWYSLFNSPQTQAGDDLKVLLCQLTTSGEFSGVFNFEVATEIYPNDEEVEGVVFSSLDASGCTNPEACNYSSLATSDDGTCNYPPLPWQDCDGNCLNDTDDDGICDEFEIIGCLDEASCNFNPEATSPATCIYPNELWLDCNNNCLNDSDADGICDEFETFGCTDPTACNFNPLATSNVECVYPSNELFDCDGECLNDADGDGICDESEILGCLEPSACNYIPLATEADTCTFPAESWLQCNGLCINDEDGDGICDELEVYGCTNEDAQNFNCFASEYDNSCILQNLGEPNQPVLAIEEYVTHNSGILEGMSTFRIYVKFNNNNDFLSSVFGSSQDSLAIITPQGFFNHEFAVGPSSNGVSSAYFSIAPELEFDSFITIGNTESTASSDGITHWFESNSQQWSNHFLPNTPQSGNSIFIDDPAGGAWYALQNSPNGFPNEEGKVLIAQFTTTGNISGVVNVQVFPNNVSSNHYYKTYHFNGVGIFWADDYIIPGCLDPYACNYLEEATVEDNSCTYPPPFYNCDLTCRIDINQNGVCDQMENYGCTYPSACNYDSEATADDQSCVFSEIGYDCNDNCLMDENANGVCDDIELSNLIDSLTQGAYCAPGTVWNNDLGQCVASTCIADLNGDSGISIMDLLILLLRFDGNCEIYGCTDESAQNFHPFAEINDGSCIYN